MVRLIEGRKVAKQLNKETASQVDLLKERGVVPGLAVVIVGNDPASERYVRMKEKKAKELGIASFKQEFASYITQEELLEAVRRLNDDPKINGILVQSPLPKQIDETQIIEAIDPKKDVDGFHPVNVGKLFLDTDEHYPVSCTPKGVMTLLNAYNIPVAGKHAVVVGRSSIVGRPMIALLLNADATVTDVHSKTNDISTYTKDADIVVSAVGRYGILHDEDFKPGATVIDVGQNLSPIGKLTGDVQYDEDSENINLITPVPGGVGPMTIATLMQQTVEMCKWGN